MRLRHRQPWTLGVLTTRSFLALLPMTVRFTDFGGREKVATPTGSLDNTGAAGLDPEAGDLFSYLPWGNIGFFYDGRDTGYSTSLTKLGHTLDLDQLTHLEGDVTIAIVS